MTDDKQATQPLPPLTEERIRELLKRAVAGGEDMERDMERVFTLSERNRNMVLR